MTYHELLVQDQKNAQTCYAITITAAIIMTIHRIEGRLRTESGKLSETTLNCLREKRIKTSGKEGAESRKVLGGEMSRIWAGIPRNKRKTGKPCSSLQSSCSYEFRIHSQKNGKFKPFLQNRENEKLIPQHHTSISVKKILANW